MKLKDFFICFVIPIVSLVTVPIVWIILTICEARYQKKLRKI